MAFALGLALLLQTVFALMLVSNLQMVFVLALALLLQMAFALGLALLLQIWLVLETVRDLQIVLDWKQVLNPQMEIELGLRAYSVLFVFLDFQTYQKPVGSPLDWLVDRGLSQTLLTILLVSLLSPYNH